MIRLLSYRLNSLCRSGRTSSAISGRGIESRITVGVPNTGPANRKPAPNSSSIRLPEHSSMPCKRKGLIGSALCASSTKIRLPGSSCSRRKGRRIMGRQGLKECDRSRHNDRRAPERSKIACLDILKIRSGMQLSATTSSGVSRKHERFPVNINRLADNAGIGQDYKDSASIPFAGLLQKMRHHRRRLAGANRTSAHGKSAMSLRRSAGLIQLSAQAAAFVRLAEFRHIVVQRTEPFLRAQLGMAFSVCPNAAAVSPWSASARQESAIRRNTAGSPSYACTSLFGFRGKKRFMLPKQCRQRSIRLCAHLGIPIFGIWSILLLQIPSTDRGNPGDGSIPALRHSRSPSSAGRRFRRRYGPQADASAFCSAHTERSGSVPPASPDRGAARCPGTMVDRIPFAFTE